MPFRSGHIDTFTRDNFPPPEHWPEHTATLPDLRYPERLNCAAELLDKVVESGHGDRPLLIHPGGVWTYCDLWEKANQIARVLTEDAGLVGGNRVLIRSANNPMMIASWMGVVKAGGVAVSTMPLLRSRELAYIVQKALVGLALCDRRLEGELRSAREQAAVLKDILCFNDDGEGTLERRMEGKPSDFVNADTAAGDVCLIGFTSGTTGRAKGAMHMHREVLAICDTYARHILRPTPEDIFCGNASLAFAYGFGALMAFPMRFGASVILQEPPAPDALLENVARHRATILFSVPASYRAMLGMMEKSDVSSLRACVSAGEHLPMPTFLDWKKRTGLELLDGIGTTEMLHIFISPAEGEIVPGSTGKPVPGYEACILDEDGAPAPIGELGRLAVRGPTGCLYLADERQAAYVLKGWNLTGDTFLVDKEGQYWHQARTDDMIVTAGYNVAGPEVESVLMEHPHVAECAVVGAPDTDRGTIVKAYVVLKDGAEPGDPLAKTLQDFVKQQIAPYKYPRAIEFVKALPRTETGKIQRFKLREGAS